MSQTAAERIERTIAVGILRGDYPIGTTLPSVRKLAEQFETTVPTIQRAVDRLAASKLVSVRRGSGITVNDPQGTGDLSIMPLWFEAFQDDPDRLGRMFSDFLEMRRVIAAHLIRTRLPSLMMAAPALAAVATSLATATTIEEIAVADSRLTRVFVDAADNFAISSVFSAIERFSLEVPQAAEALYGDRESHRKIIGEVVAGLMANDPATAVTNALENWDRRTVARFLALVKPAS